MLPTGLPMDSASALVAAPSEVPVAKSAELVQSW
jgi:hypothetical protein